MDAWQTIIALAVIVQLVTEAIARLYPRGTVFVAAAVGILVAFASQVGILIVLEVAVRWPLVDHVLTGLLLAGGASVVNALLEKLRGTRAPVI